MNVYVQKSFSTQFSGTDPAHFRILPIRIRACCDHFYKRRFQFYIGINYQLSAYAVMGAHFGSRNRGSMQHGGRVRHAVWHELFHDPAYGGIVLT